MSERGLIDRILVVEDEEKIALLLRDYLQAAGYSVQLCSRGDLAAAAARDLQPSLVLLDVRLPGCDGFDVCRQIRAESDVPIIMVTARIEEIDRILGLELGADDYVCKPFSPREVVARVRAQLRRTQQSVAAAESPQPARLRFEDTTHRVYFDAVELSLTPVEYRLLGALSARRDAVLSRDRLMDAAYDDHRVVSDRTMDSHLKNLRRKLQQAGAPEDVLQSVYGIGYRLSLVPASSVD